MTVVASTNPAASKARRFMLIANFTGPFAAVANVATVMAYMFAPPHGALALALVLFPAALLVASMVFLGLWLAAEADEFVRRISVEAMLWASGALLAAASVAGFLALYGMIALPPIWLAISYPIWLSIRGVATAAIAWRYR